MKPYTKDTHDRDRYHDSKDSKVPKRSKDRRGTRTPVRTKDYEEIDTGVDYAESDTCEDCWS